MSDEKIRIILFPICELYLLITYIFQKYNIIFMNYIAISMNYIPYISYSIRLHLYFLIVNYFE